MNWSSGEIFDLEGDLPSLAKFFESRQSLESRVNV